MHRCPDLICSDAFISVTELDGKFYHHQHLTVMKKVLLSVVAVFTLHSFAFAQTSQSLQLSASETRRAIIAAPPTLPVGTTTFTLPEVSSILISNTNTEDYNWVLGGNSSPMTSNHLGTLTNDAINFITGATGPNIRMTITPTGGIEMIGDLDRINNVTGYNWPASHQAGFLQNNGSGGLSWGNSVAASRAGIGTWFQNNYGGGATVMDVSGTTVAQIASAFPGGLSGVSVVLDNVPTVGTLTCTVTLNGVPTALTVTINGNIGQTFNFTDISGAPIAFNAGDRVGVDLNDVGFAPNNMDILVTVFATY